MEPMRHFHVCLPLVQPLELRTPAVQDGAEFVRKDAIMSPSVSFVWGLLVAESHFQPLADLYLPEGLAFFAFTAGAVTACRELDLAAAASTRPSRYECTRVRKPRPSVTPGPEAVGSRGEEPLMYFISPPDMCCSCSPCRGAWAMLAASATCATRGLEMGLGSSRLQKRSGDQLQLSTAAPRGLVRAATMASLVREMACSAATAGLCTGPTSSAPRAMAESAASLACTAFTRAACMAAWKCRADSMSRRGRRKDA